ncbi:hypothetical protein ACWFMI_24990 [Nocardiopsis terrae]|uniref:hypothetical protein n=1 Tax=Streptomyces sp. NPDC057554 TaxID=3350538 RepID=UPI00368BA8DC
MSNTGMECGDPWPHGTHRYNDDGVYRSCPGLREEPPAPTVCRSPRCPRAGANEAGFCCHGCAAHTRFGRPLLHGRRCEEDSPGAGETTPPLHDRIAEALYEPPASQDGPVARLAHHVATQRAQDRADKVMEVIKAEQERQCAAHPRSVEIDTYEQSHHDVTAALELCAEGRKPITVTTCNNSVTTYLPVRLTEETPTNG